MPAVLAGFNDEAMADRFRRSVIAAALGVALGGAWIAHAQAAEPLAWVAPDRARIVAWGEGAGQPAVEVDPSEPVALGAGELLILPIEPGERIEIHGEVEAIGLGSGASEAPDVVTWMPAPPPVAGVREVGVPAWSSARFLVLRGTTAGATEAAVRVRVATRVSAPLVWYRLDEDVAGWLSGRGGPPPAGPIEARALLRWVEAARDALTWPAAGTRPSKAAAAWLICRYLEESMRVRPLIEPYFVRRSVDVEGGRELEGESGAPFAPVEHATAWRTVEARRGGATRITLRAEGADVVRIALGARALGAARAWVRVGGAVVRELSWRTSPRVADASRWSGPRWVRIVLPPVRAGAEAREVTIEAAEGEIAAAAIGYRQRVGVADFFTARRDRAELLGQAADAPAGEPGAEVARALAAADAGSGPGAGSASITRAAAPGVAPAIRALILSEAVRWAASPSEARARAVNAYAAARGLADTIAAPLQRAALERLAEVHADPVAGPVPWTGTAAGRRLGADADDAAALAALGEALGPPRDGRRPLAGEQAERFAGGRGELSAAATRAQQTWVREAPWGELDVSSDGVPLFHSVEIPRDALLAEGGGNPATPIAAGPEGPAPRELCEVNGPHGLRWTVLDARRTEIDVDAPPGTYARVLLRGLSVEPERESSVIIDGFAASVHAGAGVGSVVAVAPGQRTFERPPGSSPVLARIPRQGKAPCLDLREIMQWVWVDRAAAFVVPDRERATVARIVLAPAPVAAAARVRRDVPAHVIRVHAGGIAYEAWARPNATGAIEVPVPRGAGELRIETDTPVLLRASARLHPAPPPPPRAVTPKGGDAVVQQDALLDTIRGATRGLRGAAEPERGELHAQRASALDQLGFPGLAALDRGPEAPLDLLDADSAPRATFTLPPGSPPVVPLGLLARIDPLPLPRDLDPLRAARSARQAGAARRGFETLVAPAADSSGADALLLGLLAEHAGEPRIASDAFARIGAEHRSGPALARAANLATDAAASDRERLSTLRALVLSELAVQAGEPPPASLARLAPVIGWRSPPRADQTAGSAAIEVRAKADRDLPLRVRVRRALLDAPEGSLLVTEGAFAQFHLRFDANAGGVVVLDSVCRALDPEATPCELAVSLDGAPVACDAGAGGGPGAFRCAVQVPRGVHRLEARPPSDRALLAWIRATGPGAPLARPADPPRPTGAPALYVGRVMSTWQDIDPERPLELAFAGPAVLRIRARAAYECADDAAAMPEDDPTCRPSVVGAAQESALRVAVDALDGNATGRARAFEGVLPLNGVEDRTARRTGVNRAPFFWLGNEVEQRIAILPEGPHALRVVSPQGRALVRVEISVATGAPRPREEPLPPPPPPESPQIEPLRLAPGVGEDPEIGPLLLGAYARLVDTDLTEDKFRLSTRHLELGVDAHRELLERRAWGGLVAFSRLRAGTPSLGAEALFDTAGNEVTPAFSAFGRVVFQPPAAGARASLTATWSIPIEEVTVLPWANLTLLTVDSSLKGDSSADRDVYTPYAAKHTTQASLGARLRLRPAVDAIVAVGPSIRLSPLPSTLDRVDLRADLDLLAGRDLFPWIQAGWVLSLRPENETRKKAFVRQVVTASVTFWSWFARGNRVSLAGEGSVLADVPGFPEDPPRLGAGLLARYDWTGGRGLRDLPPRDTPFRDRQEEGSGRLDRERSATEPSWDEE